MVNKNIRPIEYKESSRGFCPLVSRSKKTLFSIFAF
jgi:hypothetical protein